MYLDAEETRGAQQLAAGLEILRYDSDSLPPEIQKEGKFLKRPIPHFENLCPRPQKTHFNQMFERSECLHLRTKTEKPRN